MITKILFVDDEVNILHAIQRIFDKENYQLLFAKNGIEGLQILQNQKPSIIVADLKMPKMNGIDFLKKAAEIVPDSIRIVLSGLTDKKFIIHARTQGKIWRYLIKPLDKEKLINIIKEAEITYNNKKNKQINNNNDSFVESKKIYFLYPHYVVQHNIIIDLIMKGYEVYYLKDHKKAYKLFQIYNDSIVFINIDEILNESEWEKYIKNIMNNDSTKNIKIGILTFYENQEIMRKYLMEIMVPCGFIHLKADINKCKNIITKTLEVNEVKGTRKHLRIQCDENTKASLNIQYEGNSYNGKILDISSTAMACNIDEAYFLEIDNVIKDIQLNLSGRLILITGIIKMKKMINDKSVYVIHFQQPLTDKANNGIFRFIHYSLQQFVEKIEI